MHSSTCLQSDTFVGLLMQVCEFSFHSIIIVPWTCISNFLLKYIEALGGVWTSWTTPQICHWETHPFRGMWSTVAIYCREQTIKAAKLITSLGVRPVTFAPGICIALCLVDGSLTSLWLGPTFWANSQLNTQACACMLKCDWMRAAGHADARVARY